MQGTTQDIVELIRSTAFPWRDSIIHAFFSGSEMHGAKGNKPTDIDIAGVYIQPVEMILGIDQKSPDGKWFDPDVHVWKAVGDNTKVAAGEVDLNLFSLRKWAGMAASGNTTALEFLFVKNLATPPGTVVTDTIWENHIIRNTDHFISKKAGHHFIAFAKAMLLRLNGGNTGKHGQRPELEAEFGYDTKGAMHMLRVLGEGIELVTTGRITLPCPEAPYLKDVRNGKFSRDEINATANMRFEQLEYDTNRSFLPDELDRAKVSEIITKAQLEFWGF